MFKGMKTYLQEELRSIEEAGLYKRERIIITPQNADIKVEQGQEVVNFCANNYLGLSDHPRLIEAAKRAMDTHGFGMSSVRFICGTQDIHKALEKAIADYFHTEDTILYAACFDANGGIFEPLFGEEDAIISDTLNHASIIDGVRLSKAKRYRYANADMADLERCLQESQEQRFRIIVTDGVFSMDGDIAPLDKLYELSREYNALLMVDDAHATGTIGNGHGTAAYFGLEKEVDIQLGTLSKSFGSVGGYVAANSTIVDYLVNTSRSFIFSTALSPADIGAALCALHIIDSDSSVLERLQDSVGYMSDRLNSMGIYATDDTPIFPILIGKNEDTLAVSNNLYEAGIIGTAIRPPTVPVGESRIRLTVTAAHSKAQIDYVCDTLYKAIKELS